jgi:hypothetical protein
MIRRMLAARMILAACAALSIVALAGCDVNAGTRTSDPRPTTLGAAANNGAGVATAVQTGDYKGDATPDRASAKTGDGTETGK